MNNNSIENLNKKERYDLERQEKMLAQETVIKNRSIRKTVSWIFLAVIAVAAVGGLIWYIATRPPTPESDIISKTGFHWHPELIIYVKGVKQEIPANIGLPAGMGAVHQPIHTHDDSDRGIIHMEFEGLVLKQNTTLGQFFKNWGKDINSFGENMKMTVNGQENTDYENYIMRDNDQIIIYYEEKK